MDGTFYVFDAARHHKVPKVVYLSSMVWYFGDSKYGFTKVVGEQICEYFHKNHDIRYVALRPVITSYSIHYTKLYDFARASASAEA